MCMWCEGVCVCGVEVYVCMWCEGVCVYVVCVVCVVCVHSSTCSRHMTELSLVGSL